MKLGEGFHPLAALNERLRTEVIEGDQVEVVVGGILEGRTGKVEGGEVGEEITAGPHKKGPPGGEEEHPVEHGEDLVGGRTEGHHHGATADGRPLAQVLHEEEGVEDV